MLLRILLDTEPEEGGADGALLGFKDVTKTYWISFRLHSGGRECEAQPEHAVTDRLYYQT